MISIRKLLFRDEKIPFAAIAGWDAAERVYLNAVGSQPSDITSNHWIVCQDPFIVAIWGADTRPASLCEASLSVHYGGRCVANIRLTAIDDVPCNSGYIKLMVCSRPQSFHLTIMRRTAILNYLWLTQTRRQSKNLKNFCVTYSYPRRVVLISFFSEDHFNIFPMDFQGYISECGQYLLGLRRTNPTLAEILQKKRFLVSEVPFSKNELIYQLGKHHSTDLASPKELPFSCSLSARFGFPYPDFASSYYEVQLTHASPLGSHTLLLGDVINKQAVLDPDEQLFHVHSLHRLHVKNNNIIRQ